MEKKVDISLEQNIFRSVLWVGCVFWFFGFIKEFIIRPDQQIIYLDFIQFVVSIVLLILHFLKVKTKYLINVYCSTWLIMYVLFWINLGGSEGPVPHVFFSVMLIFVGVLTQKTRLFFVILLSLISIVLTYNEEVFKIKEYVPYKYFPISIDFFLNTLIVSVLIVHLKRRFNKKRNEIREHNIGLEKLTNELDDQNRILSEQQEEIKQIQNNLERIIRERTSELNLKKSQLEDYAYDNAHHLRAPLTNILGIIDILEGTGQIKDENSSKKIDNLKKHTIKLDLVVKRINTILK